MDSKSSRAVIGSLVGRYRITRELARGGMGVVYEAVHDEIAHRAAIKVLSAELSQDPRIAEHLQRFRNEAKSVNLINHTGIVRIFDFGQFTPDDAYILMEFLEGQSLLGRLQSAGSTLPLSDTCRFARQIASALAAAHSKGIVHRDLKPGNIIIVKDPEAPNEERTKIVDFGIAKFLDTEYLRTTVGLVIGTPPYMSPEQCRGTADVSYPTDVYALGIMMYRMLTGRVPFEGPPSAVLAMHTSMTPPPINQLLTSLPDDITNLIHRMLDKAPEQRPSMQEVEDNLRRIQLPSSEQPTIKPGQLSSINPSHGTVSQEDRSLTRSISLRDGFLFLFGAIVALLLKWLLF